MPVRSRSRCSSAESRERASERSATHSASSASASGRTMPPSPSCAGGSSTSVRSRSRRSSAKSSTDSSNGSIGATAAPRNGPIISSVRLSEARSRGIARRKRTFCAMRSRSKTPRRISRSDSRRACCSTSAATASWRCAIAAASISGARIQRVSIRVPIEVAQRSSVASSVARGLAPCARVSSRCLRVAGSRTRNSCRR